MSGVRPTQEAGSAAGCTTADGALRGLLEWEHALLAAPTLAGLLEAAASAGRLGAVPAQVSLLLGDPSHELRHMLLGGGRTPAPQGLLFTDSLIGIAPQLAMLHEPWRGEFRTADHELLFPDATGIERVVLLPLRSRGVLVGCLGLGASRAARMLEDFEPWALAHACEIAGAALERLLDALRLRRGGHTNPLTGWHTRQYLQARLREAIARCHRHGGDVSCVLIDVDGLKSVNDAYGQLAGDAALHEIATRIEGQLRASDAAAHVAADEFAVLLPDTRVDAAVPLAERILDAIRSEPIQAGPGLSLPMSVSIGLAAVSAGPQAGQKSLSDHLLAKAESALHLAKTRGGNRYSLADS